MRTDPYSPFFLLICPESTRMLGISIAVEDSKSPVLPSATTESGLWHNAANFVHLRRELELWQHLLNADNTA